MIATDYQPIRNILDEQHERIVVNVVCSLALKICEICEPQLKTQFYQMAPVNLKAVDYGTHQKVENCRLSLKNCQNLSNYIENENSIIVLRDEECSARGKSNFLFKKSFDINLPTYSHNDPDPFHQKARRKITNLQLTTQETSMQLHVMAKSTWEALQEVISNYNKFPSLHPLKAKCCVIL